MKIKETAKYLGLLFIALFSSCSEKEQIINEEEVKVLFSVDEFEGVENSRTSVDPSNKYAITWASGDAIGIFPREGYQEPFIIPTDQVGKSNAEFDGGYWALKDGLTYNAYYPFDKANFESAEMKTKIPVSYVGQEQNGTTCSVGAYDYLYSDWNVAKFGTVSFKFHHLGSLVVLRVPLPTTATYTTVSLNTETNVIPTKGTYNLTAEVPQFIADNSSLTTSLTLKLNNYEGLDETDAIFYMMMPPVDLNANSLSLTLTDSNGNDYHSSLPSVNIEKAKLIQLKATPLDYNIAVEWVSLNKTSVSLYEGGSTTIKASVSPSNAKNKNIAWSSSDEAIATVKDGVIQAIAPGKAIIKATSVDGSNKYAECEVFVRAPSDGTANGHDYVDLGIRDSEGNPIFWATMNIGASSETGYGYYYAWGETTTKSSYTIANYKWNTPGSTDKLGYNKYQIADNSKGIWYDESGNFIGDGLTTLEAEDDAATANWGDGWRMPTKEEMEALIKNCNLSFEYPMIKISNKDDNTKFILLPQAGYKTPTGHMQSGGWATYWTSTIGSNTFGGQVFMVYSSLNPLFNPKERFWGFPIRPVYVPSN